MSANPIPAPSDDSVPLPVEEIEAVFAKHAVPCGSPDSLAQFMPALVANKHLAMDFWSLIARLTGRPGSDFADPDCLLATIVEAVTGQNLAHARAAGPAQQILIGKLAGMLAGEDILEPVAVAPSTSSSSHHQDHHPRLVLKSETPFAAAMDRSTREQQLDHPEDGTAKSGRNFSDPDWLFTAIVEAVAGEDTQAPPPPRPVQSARKSVSRKLLGGLLLLALAAGGVSLLYHSNWKRLNTSIDTQYAAVTARKDQTAALSAASIESGQPSITKNPSLGPAGSRSAAPENPPQFLAPHNPRPAAPSAASVPIGRPNLTARTVAQVEVPQSEMRQNLVSSRVPIFPAGASGPVVVKAIVTSQGTVQPVRVVSGDPALARAAMAAVATWRYRPYLLDGVPVSVSTTIQVDSAGNN